MTTICIQGLVGTATGPLWSPYGYSLCLVLQWAAGLLELFLEL